MHIIMGMKYLIITTFFTIGASFADILPNTTLIEIAECGTQVKSNTEPLIRITGGNETYYGEFPWIAALHYRNNNSGANAGVKCGGFVVNKKFVVTAAYCLHLERYTLDEVWLGVRRISEIETTDVNSARKFKIEKKIVHEKYDSITSRNDIALLQLENEIQFTAYIRPICLPAEDEPVPDSGTRVMLAGWGRPLSHENQIADHKLKIDVPVFKHDVCEVKLGHQIRSTQICAEGETSKGSCWGDQGGPVMLTIPYGTEKKWFSIGIISWINNQCNENGKPSIHTRVSSFVPWILRKIETSS